MFYDQNQVEDLLSCSSCQKRYDLDKNRPLLLPCYKTICETCIRSRIILPNLSNETIFKYTCFYCENNHDLNIELDAENGNLNLPLNESLAKLLNLRPVDVHKAELIRKLADLVKQIKLSLDELDYIEMNSEQNFLSYFDLIKNEINTSTNYLIEQAIQYRDKLLLDIDHIKYQSVSYLNELFGQKSKLNELKSQCLIKKNEWQKCNNLNEEKTIEIIHEANILNDKLNETKQYLNNIIRHKLIFNQREPIHLGDKLSSSLVGQLDLNLEFIDHTLNLKLLNDIVRVKCFRFNNEDDSNPLFSHQTLYLLPMLFKRLLVVNKLGYDEFSDYDVSVMDLNGRVIFSNKESTQSCKINACACYLNHILISLTDYKTGRETLKLYDSSLKLINSIFIEYKSNKLFLTDMFIYVLLMDSQHPYVLKFDYNLIKHQLFENLTTLSNNELFVSFVVDKLIYISSQRNKIYFVDNAYSKIKIYSELTGELEQTVNLGNKQKYCSIYIDSILNLQEQFICLNLNEKWIKLFDKNNYLLAESKLSDEIINISKFYLTQDGSYVFVDCLNDSIYYYN
jgi:hypothetical protein